MEYISEDKMKPRDLKTTFNLIASNYKKKPIGEGRFLHSFTPKNTNKIYQFEANGTNEIIEGEYYNVGYREKNGLNIVDPSFLSKSSHVDKRFSYLFSLKMSEEKHEENKEKNDARVHHSATSGYYWGKKYAWREFGLAIPHDVFLEYLKHINHPNIPCQTIDPNKPFVTNNVSTAYLEEGIKEAIEKLIESAEKTGNGPYFRSPLYFKGERKFVIKGIASITDKK